jgi:multiple sugar transport system substrate-binding protein
VISRRSALLAAPAVLTACARDDRPVLRFWAMGREGLVANELLRGFEAEHPGVTVKVESLPWLSAHEKLLTAFAGDATPDVAQLGNTWLPEFQQLGALEPLEPWIAQSGLPADDYFPGIWATNLAGGQRIGLPWYVDTRLLFVRHDLLARAGWPHTPQTWDDWRQCLAALRRNGMAAPLLLPTNEFEPLLALALQQGDELLREGGRYGNFRSPGFQKALSFYLERFAAGDAPGITNNQISNLWQEFGRGSFAFYLSGPWNIGEFKRRMPPELADSWSTAELPGPTALGASAAGGASLGIFKRSRHKALAWALAEYLSRPAVQLQFYRLTGDLPPRRSTWRQPIDATGTLVQDRHAAAFYRQLQRARATPAVPEWERIVQEMQLEAARAVHRHTPVPEAAAALDARVDALLEKRRWMLARHST